MLDLSILKICFLAGTLGQGGAERQLYYILSTLRQCGSGVRVLSLTRGEFWEERIQALGVPVTWVGNHPSRVVRLVRIIQELRVDPPEIVQCQHFHTNLYAATAARILGIREMGALRNDTISEVRRTGRLMGCLSLRAPRRLVANSHAALRTAVEMGCPGGNIAFLPNVVDTRKFTPEPDTTEQAVPVRLMAIGRLTRQKRLDRFLSVLKRLRCDESLEVEGIIVGDGPDRDMLEILAANHHLQSPGLQFVGAVPETPLVYRSADALVLTSDCEGTPNVVLEAMSSGLPVVATRVGGVEEVVSHGETGFVVDRSDEDGMVEALSRLIRNPELRNTMGKQARKFIEQHHSLELLPNFLKQTYTRSS